MRTTSGNDLSVILSGPYFSHSGFSKTNRELALRLVKRGVRVKTDICNTRVEVSKSEEAEIRRLSNTQVPKGTPMVYSMTMPPIISGDCPRILYTMMESSNSVHQEYAEKMNLASEVWVPTTHMSDALSAAGISTPVYIVPLGVDEKVFSPESAPARIPGARAFRFLSLSWWGPRKGFDLLVKAFVGEFDSDEDVCLVISSRAHDNRPSSKIAEEIAGMAKSTGKTDRPPIILISKIMTDNEVASIYNACNVFVLATRGEGFSFPICEAASCGLPVISTRCTAQATYLDDTNSYLINPEGYELANPQDGRSSSVGRWCKFYEHQPFPIFTGKSIKRLGELMRETYVNRKDAEIRAMNLSYKVRSKLTWDNTVNTIIERLADLAANGGKR